jgi:superfamily II DNA or RNA helicase
MLKNTLLDNSSESLSMCNFMKLCISNDQFDEIMIATGYWDLPGMTLIYDELKTFLNRQNVKLRILIGKEPLVRLYQQKAPSIRDRFPNEYIKTEIHELELKDEYQAVVDLLMQHCLNEEENSKIQIRIYGQKEIEKFLHAKCYIFKGVDNAIGMIGSSNFTKKGLVENEELNYLETTPHIITYPANPESKIKGHIGWFNEKWNESEIWNRVFLEEILIKSPIAKKVIEDKEKEKEIAFGPVTPFYLYIKHLQNNWGDAIDDWHSDIDHFMPLDPSFKRLKYQTEAVNQGISIMKKHGGFILADVVGLGKTMVGAMIIKRFLLLEATDNNKPKSVLIVSPPSIKQNWLDTIDYFDKGRDYRIKDHIQFITTGSIGKLVDDVLDNDFDTDNFSEDIDTTQSFGLILIDESHKFRNSGTDMYKNLEKLTGNSSRPYVVLLSATPQNNKPDDLKNQIYLFQHERNNTSLDTIKDKKLDTYFNNIIKEYRNLIRSTNEDGTPKTEQQKKNDLERLKIISADLREKIINPLVVRRTRTDVEKYYEEDIHSQGLKFPKIIGPIQLKYEMKERLAQLFYDTLQVIAPDNNYQFDQAGALGFFRYRAIEHLISEEHKSLYENKNRVEATALRLARIMQMLLVKRLESSFAAFRKSLHNMQHSCQNMIDMYNDDCVFICPDIDVNAELSLENRNLLGLDGCYEAIRRKIAKKDPKNKEFKRHELSDDYIELVKGDMQIINNLISRWESERNDPKLFQFIKHLENTFFDPQKNNPHNPEDQKLVIFTEAIDTVEELKNQIELNTDFKVLAITAKNRKDLQSTIIANFDANYKGVKANDYHVIVTTEVLAEGINLHRANTILNYDTPWNATRLMQRIGRVNRIGSMADNVFVYNFFPSSHGDMQIDLVKKALTKLQSFHSLFGEDSQVFSTDEEVVVHDLPEMVIEDSESPSAKHIAVLRDFKKDNPAIYNHISNLQEGLNAARKSGQFQYLCHIKSGNKDGLYYRVNDEGCNQISTIEMAYQLECSIDEPLINGIFTNPEWEQMAIASFKDYLINVGSFISVDKTKVVSTALKILVPLIKTSKGLSEQSKKKLIIARGLIEQGNSKLANSIIDLNKKLQNTLFDTEDNKLAFIENFITNHLSSLQNTNQTFASEPKIVLSSYHI